MQTHTVFNQAKPLVDYNMYATDFILKELCTAYGAGWSESSLESFGAFAGSAEANAWAVQANTSEPVLHTHDRFGNRIDEVEYHPAYHQLMSASIENSLHCLPWREAKPGAHVARAALMYMSYQNEGGHCCPISMTYSVVPSLRKQPDLAGSWEPLILSTSYDSRFRPATQKKGITLGMGMTEKQGGSDVRANTTSATPVAQPGPGKEYLLTGHKWFVSAPMSDAFLVLAQAKAGLSCFLVPRWKPDGARNGLFLQRLKDKLGNRSNASSEIEFVDALGWLVGEEGRGVPTIIEMVNHTRLDCTIGSAALMRQATLQALHHCHHRSTFGKRLSEHPLMLNVLADLSLEWEAGTRLMMRVARAYDRAAGEEGEALFKRVGSAIAKYWLCKRGPMHVAEALECLGGNGYVEESPMPRLYRETPVLGIWEGSGNVICLDVLRAIGKEPETVDALVAELDAALGESARLDSFLASIKDNLSKLKKNGELKDPAAAARHEQGARLLVERLALALQATLMLRQAPGPVAVEFINSRLDRQGGLAFGTLSAGADVKAIVERAYPFSA